MRRGRKQADWRELRPTAGERGAALAALLMLVAAALLVTVGVATHFAAVVIALMGLLICTTAGWYAVSRRGARRVIAIAAVVVAVAAFIIGLLLGAIPIWRAAVVAALAAGSVLTSRHALRRHRAQRHRARAVLAIVARPARPVLIMNLKSGGGKAERFHLAEECRKRGIEPVALRPGDDLRRIAEDAADRGADVIGMAGGDGSQALVAAVAARHGLAHVCVPAGTWNHFALDLGLDRDDVTGALDAFTDGAERRVDLGSVNGRVFVNNASLGVYAKVVRSPHYRDAKLRTTAAMLPDLLGPDATPLDLRFTGPDGAAHPSAHLILVSNNPYQLVRPGGWGTRERMDQGMLGIVAVRVADAADGRRFLMQEVTGQVRRSPGWLEWAAPRFEVHAAGPVEVGVDGESLTMAPPLVFESLPEALRVRVPRRAVRASPSARTIHVLSVATVTELLRLAAGARLEW